ncbi:hypothetical protein L596_019954 [Steinernema carpocapsae]|uniref:Uncharacterized protein n=1 Tax=Steinernema carpocapsae TaxID=34508 RepID=A0A4U5MS53_STECR|nr:hypothetical protein L596_019954 [Steinernema carpocapsae]
MQPFVKTLKKYQQNATQKCFNLGQTHLKFYSLFNMSLLSILLPHTSMATGVGRLERQERNGHEHSRLSENRISQGTAAHIKD